MVMCILVVPSALKNTTQGSPNNYSGVTADPKSDWWTYWFKYIAIQNLEKD